MKCPKCGKENPDENKFCLYCGAPTGKRTKNSALIIGIIAGALIIAGGIVAGSLLLGNLIVKPNIPVESTSPIEITPSPEESSDSTPSTEENEVKKPINHRINIYNIYAEIVTQLQSEHGVGAYSADTDTDQLSGLCVVRLIDFDGDGTDELLCAYRGEESYVYNYSIFGVDESGVIKLVSDEACPNNGSDVSPCLHLYEKDGKTYLAVGISVSFKGDYYTVKDGEWVSGGSYFAPYMVENGDYLVNEKTVTEQEYKDYLASFSEIERIDLAYEPDGGLKEAYEKTEEAIQSLH